MKPRYDNPDDALDVMARTDEVLARYGLTKRPLLKRHSPLTAEDERYIEEPFYRQSPGFVYFIQAGEGGPIKIGYSSDPRVRAGDLQTAHHEQLRLLCTTPGDMALEAKLHKRFKRSRIRGEWFRPSWFLRQYIEALRA